MAVKQGFQFLDTFGLRRKDEVMLLIGQRNEIANAIVVLDSIEMMNNPILWQQSFVRGFPDKDVFSNITISVCTRMVLLKQKNIATFLHIDTAFPVMVCASISGCDYTLSIKKLLAELTISARTATFCFPQGNRLAAVNTVMVYVPEPRCTLLATLGSRVDHLTTVNTWVFLPFTPSAFVIFSIHSLMIPQYVSYINLNRQLWVREIVLAANEAGVPVFLKDNMKSLLPATAPFVTNPLRDLEFGLRQELPE